MTGPETLRERCLVLVDEGWGGEVRVRADGSSMEVGYRPSRNLYVTCDETPGSLYFTEQVPVRRSITVRALCLGVGTRTDLGRAQVDRCDRRDVGCLTEEESVGDEVSHLYRKGRGQRGNPGQTSVRGPIRYERPEDLRLCSDVPGKTEKVGLS